MKTRAYFGWFLLGILIAVLLLITTVIASLKSQPEAGRWVSECLTIKTLAIKNKNPKLVILSGSNSLFGFSARRLSELYGIESVNAGVHAGLGLNYMLYFARNHIAKNRVFVLPLEYELYSQPSNSGAFIYQIIGFDTDYFSTQGITTKAKIISEIEWLGRARLIKYRFFPDAKNQTDGYQSRNLNDWGDETSNLLSNRTSAMISPVRKVKPKKYWIDNSIWEELELFTKEVKAAGGRVVLTYPNIYIGAFDKTINQSFFDEILQRSDKLGITVIGKPEASVFKDEFVFDTYYHQNTLGQIKSTDRLYNDLHQAGIF